MRTMLKPRLMALAVVAALGTTACASATGSTQPNNPSPNQAPQSAKVRVNVTNNNYYDVEVYALSGGMYQHLAMVPSMTNARLRLPRDANLAEGVRLLVHPIGTASAFLTEEIMVDPGDAIDLTVTNPVQLTNWTVS